MMRRIHYYINPQGESESGLSLTEVKKRIRKFGGSGYTQHFDRDGSFQETTPIVLGNNARTTYQAEYNTSNKFRIRQQESTDDAGLDIPSILDKVTAQAKTENIQEEDDDRLMEILAPMLGDKAPYIIVQWYDWALCQIHGRLYHEFRGMNRNWRRNQAINKWKNENKKKHENNNQD